MSLDKRKLKSILKLFIFSQSVIKMGKEIIHNKMQNGII